MVNVDRNSGTRTPTRTRPHAIPAAAAFSVAGVFTRPAAAMATPSERVTADAAPGALYVAPAPTAGVLEAVTVSGAATASDKGLVDVPPLAWPAIHPGRAAGSRHGLSNPPRGDIVAGLYRPQAGNAATLS